MDIFVNPTFTLFYPFLKCPEPCHKMQTIFGFPFYTNIDGKTFARLYFKNTVRVTEDFVSYDLLRY